MEQLEAGQAEKLTILRSEASRQLDANRGDRVDNLTATSHSDHWAHELYLNASADIAQGRVDNAKEMINFWVENIAEDGRVPHMIIDSTSWRRRHIDRRVLKAEKNPNGEWITPLSAMPNMSLSALTVAEAIEDESERKQWLDKILPKLTTIKEWQYRERDIDGDGLLSQLHPDETFFRHGTLAEHVLKQKPATKKEKYTEQADKRSDNKLVGGFIRKFRKSKFTGGASGAGDSSYDPDQYMSVGTAARTWDAMHHSFGEKFKIKDVAANALFIRDNEAYERICEYAGDSTPGHLAINFARTKENFGKFWDEKLQKFGSLDSSEESLAEHVGAEASLSLLGRTAMNDIQVVKVLSSIEDKAFSANFPLATGDQPEKIHRGAMHPDINFLVYMALDSSSPRESAIKARIGNSVTAAYFNSAANNKSQKSKFSQAYNPNTSRSLGADYWGPTAAAGLVMSVDLLKSSNR